MISATRWGGTDKKASYTVWLFSAGMLAMGQGRRVRAAPASATHRSSGVKAPRLRGLEAYALPRRVATSARCLSWARCTSRS
jgi:hypothetical protein